VTLWSFSTSIWVTEKFHALPAASACDVWDNTVVFMGPEQDCVSCDVSTIRATARNKDPHTGGTYPGEHVFMGILHAILKPGLRADITFPFYLILVDAYSRYTCIYGLPKKSSDCVKEKY
jgi:hypothetical protein